MKISQGGKNTTSEITAGVDASSYVTGGYGSYKSMTSSCYPINAAAVSVSSGGSAHGDGSWVEIVPASTITKDILITGLSAYVDSVSENHLNIEIALGTGSGGSETEIIRVSHSWVYVSNVGWCPCLYIPLSIPIKVSANTRIACRIADAEAAANDFRVKINYVEMS